MQVPTDIFNRSRYEGPKTIGAGSNPLIHPPHSRPTSRNGSVTSISRSGLDSLDKPHTALKPSAISPNSPMSHLPNHPIHSPKPVRPDHNLPRKRSALHLVSLASDDSNGFMIGNATSKDTFDISRKTKDSSTTYKPGVLTLEQANAKCSTPEQVVTILNSVHSNVPITLKCTTSLRSVIASYISQGFDFGAIYARFRPHWPKSINSFTQWKRGTSFEDKLVEGLSSVERVGESEMSLRQRSAVGQNVVEASSIRPLRLWDLYANRVIPSYYSLRQNGATVSEHPYWAVSHSELWIDSNIDTPVNGHERPISLPHGANLEGLRAELLRMGAEYVWIDLLCRRKVSSGVRGRRQQEEDLIVEHDIPTGIVCERFAQKVVRYKDGLGRETDGPIDPKAIRKQAFVARIPLQESRMFPAQIVILSPEQADMRCSSPEQVLAILNGLFHTSLDITHGPLQFRLHAFIKQGFDFGAIFARLRLNWPRGANQVDPREDAVTLETGVVKAMRRGKIDERRRKASMKDRTIIEPILIKPRRLWDLRANRVVPYHYTYSNLRDVSIWAISHSWTESMDKLEGRLDTSINGHAWPVPVPDRHTLEQVRTEMLNLGAEYVWLDVLCIRQISQVPAREEMRKKEWMVDLPTIGVVFDRYAQQVVRYMNGLGRAFEPFGWDDPRHWLNRAWTLQEAKVGSIVGGIPEGVDHPRDAVNVFTCEHFKDRLEPTSRVEAIRSGTEAVVVRDLTFVMNEMRQRKAANPLDKVFGVALMFCREKLPLYDSSLSIEEAWSRCVEHLPPGLLGIFLFKSPIPGNGNLTWRPSWTQLMADDARELHEVRPFVCIPGLALSVQPDGKASYLAPVLRAHFTPDSQSKDANRTGNVSIQTDHSKEVFRVNLYINQSLPENDYFFVGEGYELTWLVCLKTKEGFYRKVAVVTMANGMRLGNFDKKYEYCLFV